MLICSHLEWALVTVWIMWGGGGGGGGGVSNYQLSDQSPFFWAMAVLFIYFHNYPRKQFLSKLLKTVGFFSRLRFFDDKILWSAEYLLPLLKWEIIHPEWSFLNLFFFFLILSCLCAWGEPRVWNGYKFQYRFFINAKTRNFILFSVAILAACPDLPDCSFKCRSLNWKKGVFLRKSVLRHCGHSLVCDIQRNRFYSVHNRLGMHSLNNIFKSLSVFNGFR